MYTNLQTRRKPGQLYAHGLMGFGDAASAAVGGAISAGVSLATSAASLWMNSIQLSHDAMTATTQIVNGLEPLLRQNTAAYLAGPGTCADQAAALAAYDSAIQWLRSPAACGNGAYGSAGNACISDRIGAGAKWPWDSYYRDPIANDPRAAQCAAQTAASNPDAGEQAAISNIIGLTQGSTTQTNAGLIAASSVGSSGTAATGTTGAVATDPLTALTQTTIAGIPVLYLIGGALLVYLATK